MRLVVYIQGTAGAEIIRCLKPVANPAWSYSRFPPTKTGASKSEPASTNSKTDTFLISGSFCFFVVCFFSNSSSNKLTCAVSDKSDLC